ncbi:hypothetical protein PVAP13_2KG170700 [Panicum virgatum]|uniref:DUF4283 domain-containing protein n=1 Tax=Panicum virgatum TaxID=38727 RepID=A0A8T0W3X3_PANVG|nr:hypothetical protein PVAP13_2KG170700 [Panicum virgatum]
MKGVQPTAIPCGYAVEGLGFYYIPYAGLPKAKPEEKLATVNVLDGSFTTEQMSVELERLLPDKETWNLQQQGVDSFSLNFPSAVLLDQMVKWGPMETKTAEGKISFEKGVENEVFKYEIPKIWVQFRGLPKDLREFPIIWAVGSILGSSRAVDMKFTKTFGQSRLKVAVLNPELIPELVDVVIGDFVYELQFRAEKEDQSDDPKPIDMEAPLDDDKHGEDDGPEQMEEDARDVPENVQPPAANAPSGAAGGAGASVNGRGPQMANAAAVFKEKSASTGAKPKNPIAKPVVLLNSKESSQDGTQDWQAEPLPNSGALKKKQLVTVNTATTPTRSSKRTATTGDQDTLEKAAKLKARKNLDGVLTPGLHPES